MIAIDDPDLPGLAGLGRDSLRRITGSGDVALMRLRYRAGKRAILHLDAGGREGALWVFRGDKGIRIARQHRATARYDAETGAVYEAFPNDHRLPQIRDFIDRYADIAPALVGGMPAGGPELLRYRPGLSCTFGCDLADGRRAFVKLIRDASPARISTFNRQMTACLTGGPVAVAPVIGTDAEYSAVAFSEARGQPLDAALATSSRPEPLRQTIDALRRFWAMPLTPARHLTADVLLARGAECVALTAATVPAAVDGVARVLAKLRDEVPQLIARPIHADVKLEHLFINGDGTTLIDTESVSLGPPDYDLAQLFGRLWQAQIEGRLSARAAAMASRVVRRSAGQSFDWCLGIVALRLARFYAQRPSGRAADRIATILRRLQ